MVVDMLPVRGSLIIAFICVIISIPSNFTTRTSDSPPYDSPPFEFVTPWVWESPPKLTIESPINGTYTGRAILNFTVEAPNNWFNNQSENWNEFNLKKSVC